MNKILKILEKLLKFLRKFLKNLRKFRIHFGNFLKIYKISQFLTIFKEILKF